MTVDILLLILLVVGFIRGLFSGAVKQLISLVAFVAGFVGATIFYQQLGDVLLLFIHHPAICYVAAFALLWFIVPIAASLIASLITKMVNEIPVLGTLNRVLGGFLCLLKYALVLGALIWLFSSMELIPEETMQQSKLCGPLKAIPESVYNVMKYYHPGKPLHGTQEEDDAPIAPCDTIPDEGDAAGQ